MRTEEVWEPGREDQSWREGRRAVIREMKYVEHKKNKSDGERNKKQIIS